MDNHPVSKYNLRKFLKGVFNMKITIGSDHGAVDLKEAVKKVLAEFEDIEYERRVNKIMALENK